MALRIFPHVLIRYAGMPLHVLHTAALPDMEKNIRAVAQWETQLRQQKNAVCELLYTAINRETDGRKRQQLLQLKRNIFNDKLPVMLSAEMPHEVQVYLQQIKDREKSIQQWQQDIHTNIIAAREALQQYVQTESLRRGILLSSPVLYEQLNNFAAADSRQFKSRELKNEYSLLRYLSRMAAKTSPFSTFTYIGNGQLVKQVDKTDARQVHSSIRLHNGLFSYLRLLMVHHPVLNETVRLKLNVTATLERDELHFLVNYFNVEAFQRLPARNLPLWLFHYLKDHNAVVNIGQLTDHLCTQIADTDRTVIKSFLLKCVLNGLLDPSIGCTGIDPEWDRQLLSFLSPYTTVPVVSRVHTTLTELQLIREAYAIADANSRRQLLQQASVMLNELFHGLQQEAGLPDEMPVEEGTFRLFRFQARRFLPQDIFYEDTYTKQSGSLSAQKVTTFMEEISQLCGLLRPLDALQQEREHMRTFFLQQYDTGKTIPVIQFYHDYYRFEKKPAAGQGPKKEVAPIVLPETLQTTLDNDTVHINAGNEMVLSATNAGGVFAQFYQEGGQLQGVVNALLPGMGKVAGRFLHLLAPSVTETFKVWNEQLHVEKLLLELNDGSVFNANIHPPLLSYEVCMPGGNNIYAPEAQVVLQEIVVRYNQADDALELFHIKQQRVVYAYDLSLESFYNRSHFYRLLAHFNEEQRVPVRGLISAIDRQYMDSFSPDDDIQVRPRIRFGKQVILRRKGWLLKTSGIPVCGQEESNAAYIIRLNMWRVQHGLPEQCFLFLQSPYIPVSVASQNKLQRDDYKPQYMSFGHPLLVLLFRKLLSRAGEWCYLEEMLPAAAHVDATGEDGIVKEYLLHWYNW